MKKIINSKLYNTDTADKLGYYSYGQNGDFTSFSETLYRKKNGEFFLYGEGGPASKYSVSAGNNSWSGGDVIKPFSEDEAREWAEEYLRAEEYIKIFGKPEE